MFLGNWCVWTGMGCCLNRGLRGFSLMGCDAPRPFVPIGVGVGDWGWGFEL